MESLPRRRPSSHKPRTSRPARRGVPTAPHARRRHPIRSWGRHPHPHRWHDLLRGESRWRRGRRRRERACKLPLVRPVEAHGARRRARAHGERIVLARLRCQETLRARAVPLALAVLLECVLDGDGLVHEELAVHGLDRGVRGFEVGEGDEAVALGGAGAGVAGDLEKGLR